MHCQTLTIGSLVWLAATLAAQPVPDFSLPDVNGNSPRYHALVSPRDYLLQVSGYYFADADCSYCRTQFGHLNTLARQLHATNPAVQIEILGVNWTEYTNANYLMTAGRQLPWLQPAATNRVQDLWGAAERDVRILDAQNRLIAVYNLTANSLAFPGNFDTLKDLFLDAAQWVDTDGDQLLDDWELVHFGSLAATPSDDADGDHHDNFTEYAFGTDPKNAASRTSFQSSWTGTSPNRFYTVTFRRRVGSAVSYSFEHSLRCLPWTPSAGSVAVTEAAMNLFDGTGTGWTTCQLTAPFPGPASGFLRVWATPGHAAP